MGSQYVSIRYSERLAKARVEPSVGSRGDSYDNALTETINCRYKAELIHRRAPWKTCRAVELATLERVTWFDHHRLLKPLGYIPTPEAEAIYYRQLSEKTRTRPSGGIHARRTWTLPLICARYKLLMKDTDYAPKAIQLRPFWKKAF